MARISIASLAFLLIGVPIEQCKGQLINHLNLRHVTSRVLQEDDRHPNTVLENELGPGNHPNPVTLRNSFFVEKYCSPDDNGYYGSTMGTPFEIGFAFEAETSPGADLEQVKSAIHESVETALLTTFFPTMCQIGVTPYDSEVTGFHFDPDATQYAQPCSVLINDDNTCGVYIGSVRVYGEEGNALAIIRDHLDRDGTENIHASLRRILSIGLDNGIVAAPQSSDQVESEGLSSGAIAGIVVALIALSVGIVALAAVQVRRSRRNAHSLSEESSRGESEISEGESVETIDLESGNAMVVADGRPRTILVDPEAQSTRSYRVELL